MTGTKRLSLHGRLRMAAACPDPNAALLAEAADAIEQHEAFRQEVSEALLWHCKYTDGVLEGLQHLIIADPDPLVEIMAEVNDANDAKAAEQLREALAKRGGKIVWENSDA